MRACVAAIVAHVVVTHTHINDASRERGPCLAGFGTHAVIKGIQARRFGVAMYVGLVERREGTAAEGTCK